KARGREDAQVHVRALVLLDPLLEQRVARLERPRHERGEAAEHILKFADRVEVVEEVVHGLDVAVHHGGRRLEATAVRFAVDLEPRLRPALLRRDAVAYAGGEHLGAAARNGPLASVPEAVEDVREG